MAEFRFIQTNNDFSKKAKDLRAFFDAQFEDPLKGHSKRFVWDYWHVEGRYSHHRTPAIQYFGEKLMKPFLTELMEWGRTNLGCHAISPPWLSYYVEGCEQRLHCDVPHGPFAFVYSLSLKPGVNFQGGRTMILKDSIFRFSETLNSDRGLENEDILHFVDPKFNRLVVFDPRFPHGVEPVRGTRDPREARLVIHGWFTQPQPWADGPLSRGNGFAPVYSMLEEEIRALGGFTKRCFGFKS